MTPQERRLRMEELYHDEGLSMGEIAERFKISRQRVHQIIGETIEKPHYGRASKERRLENLRAAHARIISGESTIDNEAKEMNLQSRSLIDALAEIGLKIPSTREPSPEHGTYYRYQKGCRCAKCQEGRKEKLVLWRKRGPARHGTVSAYRVYACRCDACRRAGSIANKEQRERRKLRDKERMPNE